VPALFPQSQEGEQFEGEHFVIGLILHDQLGGAAHRRFALVDADHQQPGHAEREVMPRLA
jgi:hypothetical protein